MKNIITKKKFLDFNKQASKKMSKDKNLQTNAIKVLIDADKKYRWLHQQSWLGEPCLNLPEDMFALQEIIVNQKQGFIVGISSVNESELGCTNRIKTNTTPPKAINSTKNFGKIENIVFNARLLAKLSLSDLNFLTK